MTTVLCVTSPNNDLDPRNICTSSLKSFDGAWLLLIEHLKKTLLTMSKNSSTWTVRRTAARAILQDAIANQITHVLVPISEDDDRKLIDESLAQLPSEISVIDVRVQKTPERTVRTPFCETIVARDDSEAAFELSNAFCEKTFSSPFVEIEAGEVKRRVTNLFKNAGIPEMWAKELTRSLIENEHHGYASHGLLRVTRYLDDLESGALKPDVIPVVNRHSETTSVVDARHGIGVRSMHAAEQALDQILSDRATACVALKNSGHIGRLYPLLASQANKGRAMVALVNGLGKGTRVAPHGHAEGLLTTNPIGLAIPTEGDPIVLDMSTSRCSEGTIRLANSLNQSVDIGLLRKSTGEWTLDPADLYDTHMPATLTSIDDGNSNKGFALGIAIEAFVAGITGAASIADPNRYFGNAAVFVAIRVDALGDHSIVNAVQSVVAHIQKKNETTTNKGVPLRIPGMRPCVIEKSNPIRFSRLVWDDIIQRSPRQSNDKGFKK